MGEIVLLLHLITLGLTAIVIALSDWEAFSWIRGKKEFLDEAKIRMHHKLVSAGLALMILTGFLLFWPMRDYITEVPKFYAKMFFVGLIVVNSFFINKLMPVAFTRKFSELTSRERLPLLASGAASAIGWVGATIFGFIMI